MKGKLGSSSVKKTEKYNIPLPFIVFMLKNENSQNKKGPSAKIKKLQKSQTNTPP